MNNHFVLPKVFFVGATNIDLDALIEYLEYTNQRSFLDEIKQAQESGLNNGEIICSFYAKLCYASLTDKKNKNITRTRAIEDNLINIVNTGHGSVIEHCNLNFVITNCSRVFTHELVRHRVGTAFSQTSGRYVRTDVLDIVVDPILAPVYDLVENLRLHIQAEYKKIEEMLGINDMTDFDKKKKLTSAMRRVLPNGQANEIGFSVNLRTLRHTIESRTDVHAEWEIRYIFNQIYELVKNKYPVMFYDAISEERDGLLQVRFKNKKI